MFPTEKVPLHLGCCICWIHVPRFWILFVWYQNKGNFPFQTCELCYLIVLFNDFRYLFINNICLNWRVMWSCQSILLFSIKRWHMPWDQQDPGYLETFTSPSFAEMMPCQPCTSHPLDPGVLRRKLVSRGQSAGGSNNLSLQQLEVLQQPSLIPAHNLAPQKTSSVVKQTTVSRECRLSSNNWHVGTLFVFSSLFFSLREIQIAGRKKRLHCTVPDIRKKSHLCVVIGQSGWVCLSPLLSSFRLFVLLGVYFFFLLFILCCTLIARSCYFTIPVTKDSKSFLCIVIPGRETDLWALGI